MKELHIYEMGELITANLSNNHSNRNLNVVFIDNKLENLVEKLKNNELKKVHFDADRLLRKETCIHQNEKNCYVTPAWKRTSGKTIKISHASMRNIRTHVARQL